MDDCNKRIFSGHDREISSVSQQLWLHAQHLRKTKPETTLSMNGGMIHEVPLLAKEFLSIDDFWYCVSQFPSCNCPPPHDPVDSWYVQYRSSMYTCAHWWHLSGLSELKKMNIWNEENSDWGIRMGGSNWVGIWYEFYQNTYAYMKASNNNENIKNRFSWDIVELTHRIILEIQF